jgi:uncharacterized protein
MKWSKFNYLYKSKISNSFLLYNSLSNSFIDVNNPDLLELFNLIKSGATDLELIKGGRLYEDLVARKIIVESDKLEILNIKNQVLRNRFSPRNVELTILPTLACNFKCPYCFATTNEGKFMNNKVEDSIIKLLSNLKEENGKINISITWMGGEPLYNYRSIVSITNRIKTMDLPFSSKLITNGYLLSKDKINELIDLGIDYVQITIDGLKEEHDKTRIHKTQDSTFARIVDNIDTFFKIYPNSDKIGLNIRVNLNKEEDYIKKFVDIHRYLKERYIYSNLYISPGFIDDISVEGFNKSCGFDRNQLKEFYLLLSTKYNLHEYSIYPANIVNECAIRSPYSFTIGPQGELYTCWENIGKGEYIVGAITENGMPIINDINVFNKYIGGSDYLDDKICTDCFFFPICNGGCPEKRLLNEYKGTSFDVCSVQKENIEEILENQYFQFISST